MTQTMSTLAFRLAACAFAALAGSCSHAAASPCSLADLSEIGGTAENPGLADGQLTVDDLIVFVNAFSDGLGCPGHTPCNLADVTAIGGPPFGPDGQLTVDDIVAFVNAFGDGCILQPSPDVASFKTQIGWVVDGPAREFVGAQFTGTYSQQSHDVLQISGVPVDRTTWSGGVGTAADGSPFNYTIYDAREFTEIGPLRSQSGLNDLRMGHAVIEIQIGGHPSVATVAMWWHKSGHTLFSISGTTTVAGQVGWARALWELNDHTCPNCSYVWICPSWDLTAEVAWRMFKDQYDAEMERRTELLNLPLLACGLGALIGCGTSWIPNPGSWWTCGTSLLCLFGGTYCAADQALHAGSIAQSYRQCLCTEAAARGLGVTPPNPCQIPEPPGCAP